MVKWDEKTVEGQAEPEHPAPSFVTTAKDAETTAPAPSPAATPAPAAALPPPAMADLRQAGSGSPPA